VDGELTAAEATRLREHRARCAACAREAERLGQLQRVLRRDPLSLTEVHLPSGEALARSVVQAAQGSPRNCWVLAPIAGLAALSAIALAAGMLGLRAPASRAVSVMPVAHLAAPAPEGFWIEDDEQSGRSILIRSRASR
jgi:anti-sigma factor RsiW